MGFDYDVRLVYEKRDSQPISENNHLPLEGAMNKQTLLMKYHPAKKEVEFHRYQNGKEVAIRNESRLMQYMNMRGKFVLQDHGNAFFDDIAAAFDGLKNVDIQVITTKLDYEDLEQMVEYYNSEPNKCKISISLLAELPNMVDTYAEVKKYGEESVGILDAYRSKLFDVPMDNENVRKSADNFSKQISDEIRNIKEKIDSLGDNNVSLCFTGVYSAGKSALINAILGYRILPEAVTSETAKMFKILSPRDGEAIYIEFDILGEIARIEWNEALCQFEFSMGPAESVIRTEIQRKLNEIGDQKENLHDQIRKILTILNVKNGISTDITVKFPIALDTESVQFTIYDTPGTDSNYLAHQTILNEALAEQTQSILIFVAHPTKLEGEGNNALLSYLKNAEEKSSKTSIDIGRSLFVMNYADTITASHREALRFKDIKNRSDDSFSIRLSDKKLFFTSARYAYAAKAVVNGVATPEDTQFTQLGQIMFTSEASPYGMCFRQNCCATSEVVTTKMRTACEAAFSEAVQKEDKERQLIISTGLYALEREIVLYGEKYASAVKAYAIIDSVDKALTKLSNKANSLRDSNQQEISAIQANIDELRKTIDDAITDALSQISIPANNPIPEDARKVLHLDRKSLDTSVIGRTKSLINDKLKGWFFGLGKVRIQDSDKDKVRNIITGVLDSFTRDFKKGRTALLEEQRDVFMYAVKTAISENGKISDAAKQYFLDIPAPQIRQYDRMNDVGDIYDSHKRTDKVLFFTTEHLDKEGFIREVEERLLEITGKMCDDYEKDYRKTLETLLHQIRSQFQTNLEDYSLSMRAMIDDREAMKKLGERIQAAADALDGCKVSLNKIIWKEIINAES